MVVVLDTNVLVSAFQFGGNPERLIDMARAGKLDVAISPSILGEFTRILRDKFGWTDGALAGATAILSRCTTLADATTTPRVVIDDANDDHVVACAVAAAASAIITGDKTCSEWAFMDRSR